MKTARWLLAAGLLTTSLAAAPAPPDTPATTPASPAIRPLILTDERLERIRQLASSDPLMSELLASLRTIGASNLASPPIDALQDAPTLPQCRRASSRLLTGAFLYRLDGDPRYLERTRENLLRVCQWPNWNPRQLLCTGETAFAVAVSFSWIADRLSDTDRATVKQALFDDALKDAPRYYARTPIDGLNWHAFGSDMKTINNWNFVCNAGFLAAALVLHEEHPQLAAETIAAVGDSLPLALNGYAPDGVWPEGPVYWHYGTGYLAQCLDLLRQQGGETAALEARLAQSPGFAHTLDYILAVFAPSGIAFNYADSPDVQIYRGNIYLYSWLANRFDRAELRPLLRHLLGQRLEKSRGEGWSQDGRPLLFAALSFPEASSPESASPLPLDQFFNGPTQLVFMRSGHDPNALWIALKGGRNGAPHSHLDLGSFVLESQGVRWAHDMGPENYLKGYWGMQNGGSRWNFYRANNLSHNTLTLGGAKQDATAEAPISQVTFTPAQASATIDLSATYPGLAVHVNRRVTLRRPGKEEPEVLIEDSAGGLQPGTELTWRMITRARAAVAEDGRSVILEQDGRKLRVAITSGAPSARFTYRPAVPLRMNEKPNTGFYDLSVSWTPKDAETSLAITMTPVGAPAR